MWHCSIHHYVHEVSLENDTDVAHYNCYARQPILVILGRDVAERVLVCYQMVIFYPTSPN